jgi:hypothetical protein
MKAGSWPSAVTLVAGGLSRPAGSVAADQKSDLILVDDRTE